MNTMKGFSRLNVGDQAKNMSEHVFYMVKDRGVRHVAAEAIEWAVSDGITT